MKFQRIIEQVYFQPWNITDSGWWDIHRIVKPHIMGEQLPASALAFIAARNQKPNTMDEAFEKMLSEDGGCPDTDFFGEPIKKLEITSDGLAIIPVCGTLIHHASLMDKMCGAVSYDDIKRDIATVMGTMGIRKVRFLFDSPGGSAQGMPECAMEILKLGQYVPTEAVSDTMIGSAAYGLAVCCKSIGITETAIIGSVGSYIAILDSSKAAAMQGYSVDVIKSGDYKGAGIDGTTMSEKQRQMYQDIALAHGEIFRELVRSNRIIEEKFLQGQHYLGAQGVELGFADRIIEDVETCCDAETGLDFEG